MKTVFIGVLLLGYVSTLFAQSNSLAGTWEIYDNEFHYISPRAQVQVDSDITVMWYGSNGGDYWQQVQAQNSGCTAGEYSSNNFTQFSYSWSYICASTDTVETRTVTATSLGNPYQIAANLHLIKGVKQTSRLSLDCFLDGPCVFLGGTVYLRNATRRIVLEDQLFVGSATNDNLRIEEIRFTDKATEVLLVFETKDNSYEGRLHPPGAEFTFFLRDSQGNRYDLKHQYGWKGDAPGGYGSFTVPKDSYQHVILYFGPASNANAINNLSLLEGACESGCWNFYDIRLKD